MVFDEKMFDSVMISSEEEQSYTYKDWRCKAQTSKQTMPVKRIGYIFHHSDIFHLFIVGIIYSVQIDDFHHHYLLCCVPCVPVRIQAIPSGACTCSGSGFQFFFFGPIFRPLVFPYELCAWSALEIMLRPRE